MTSNDPQVPWHEEQWARVTQEVQKEANRSRIAATFLPLYGPLPRDADFVRNESMFYDPPDEHPETRKQDTQVMVVKDKTVIPLTTLQVKVRLRGAQMADPNLTSVLQMFRRAANVLARLEDAIVFQGQLAEDQGPPESSIIGLPAIWTVRGGYSSKGLLQTSHRDHEPADYLPGAALVQQVSMRIGELEARGHFGPFAVVLGENIFIDAQSPTDSLVLPSDRIIPFLGGGPLLRSSTLPTDEGIVVALGAAPVEIVVATDVSVGFMQVTTDPYFVFRVFEKIALRIKEDLAIEHLQRGVSTPTP